MPRAVHVRARPLAPNRIPNNVKTVLVTGGAGYIGSQCCKTLAAAGYTPVSVDNLCRGHRDAVRWGPFCQGDIRDSSFLADVIRTHRPEAVIHFAAFAYVGESVTAPALYYGNNVIGSLSLLESLRQAGVDKIVFSSTCSTYGLPRALPIDENHPQAPVNPYGWSKLMVEQALRDYAAAYGLRWVSLRYFNAAGADPEAEIGERHDPETHLIPLVLRAITDPTAPLSLLGEDYDTPDGTCIRDYVHVQDLATAHLDALAYLSAGGAPVALNLGTGRGHSVREVIACAERITGRPVPWEGRPRRPGDPPHLVADASRAQRILGWQPAWPQIEDMIAHAWAWHQKPLPPAPNKT